MLAVADAAFVRSTVKSAAAAHVLISASSILYGTLGPGNLSHETKQGDESIGEEVNATSSDAAWLNDLGDMVQNMYNGKGIIPSRHHQSKLTSPSRVELHPRVTFEDPAAICRGSREVDEAFRALTYMKPSSITPPELVSTNVLENNSSVNSGSLPNCSISVTYKLHQRYGDVLTVRSLVRVEVVLKTKTGCSTIKSFASTMGTKSLAPPVAISPSSMMTVAEVVRIQEQWNGVSLLQWAPFWCSRRLNGLMSFCLTSILL